MIVHNQAFFTYLLSVANYLHRPNKAFGLVVVYQRSYPSLRMGNIRKTVCDECDEHQIN